MQRRRPQLDPRSARALDLLDRRGGPLRAAGAGPAGDLPLRRRGRPPRPGSRSTSPPSPKRCCPKPNRPPRSAPTPTTPPSWPTGAAWNRACATWSKTPSSTPAGSPPRVVDRRTGVDLHRHRRPRSRHQRNRTGHHLRAFRPRPGRRPALLRQRGRPRPGPGRRAHRPPRRHDPSRQRGALRQPLRHRPAHPATVSRAALAALMVALAVAAGACGVADQHSPVAIGTSPPTSQPPTTQPNTPTSNQVTVFLVHGTRLATVYRRANPGLTAAMDELLAGPTNQDLAHGLTSAIPAGTKLQAATLNGSTAEPRLQRHPGVDVGPGAASRLRPDRRHRHLDSRRRPGPDRHRGTRRQRPPSRRHPGPGAGEPSRLRPPPPPITHRHRRHRTPNRAGPDRHSTVTYRSPDRGSIGQP